jgi:hypothetical protein
MESLSAHLGTSTDIVYRQNTPVEPAINILRHPRRQRRWGLHIVQFPLNEPSEARLSVLKFVLEIIRIFGALVCRFALNPSKGPFHF